MSTVSEVVDATTTLRSVTVFKDRAQLYKTGKASFGKAGECALHITGNWDLADRESLQLNVTEGGEAVMLRAVRFRTITTTKDVRQERREFEEKLAAVKKEVRGVDDEIALQDYRIKCFQALGDKIAGGSANEHHANVYEAAKWAELATVVRTGIRTATTARRALETQRKELEQKVSSINSAISNRRMGELVTQKQVVEVLLKTLADNATVKFVLSHLVTRGASWEPIYDLRVDTQSKTVAMSYDALVKQNTSESWEDVELALSTATPHFGGTPPALSAWRITLRNPARYNASECEEVCDAPMMMKQMMTTNMIPSASAKRSIASRAAPARAVAAAVSSSATALKFTIPGRHSVKSNNEPLKTTIVQHIFEGHFRYSAVPKLSSSTYLKVKTVNDTPYILLAGQASVFADNQLVSTSSLDLVNPGEEFWTFLGVDDSISVRRKLIHKKTLDTSTMFSSRRNTIESKYLFTVKNTKKTQEEIVIWDQYPMPSDKNITVSLVEPNKKSKERFETNDMNAVEWFFHPQPNEELKFEYIFNVELSADERLDGM